MGNNALHPFTLGFNVSLSCSYTLDGIACPQVDVKTREIYSISLLSPNDHGFYLDPSVLTVNSLCVCAAVLFPLMSNLIVTATTNKFDFIKFELAFMCHGGRVGANVFFFFFISPVNFVLH